MDSTTIEQTTGRAFPLSPLEHGELGRAGGGLEMGGRRGALELTHTTMIQASRGCSEF
ncbi:hypothetical protein AB0H00_19960 [Nocardia sp. NPDC023852]|uniref:hypothetical protein n=1 Tax=Nocardia sp. NPDC023852 TaxID=3154697 RepID=UPI00340E4E96